VINYIKFHVDQLKGFSLADTRIKVVLNTVLSAAALAHEKN
jgi:hypothetical protein